MTHAELVDIAVTWLQKTRGCTVTLAELSCTSILIPDAIGWQVGVGAYSILVECKTSRADYRADLKKPIHAMPDDYPGQERWYMAPAGIIDQATLPPGWHLAEVTEDGRVACVTPWRKVIDPLRIVSTRQAAELPYLLSALRRHNLGVEFDQRRARFAPAVLQHATTQRAVMVDADGRER